MSEATGLKAGLCPHSRDPVVICDICLLRRADKGRLAKATAERLQAALVGGYGKGRTQGPASIREPPSPSQGRRGGQPTVARSLRARARRSRRHAP